MDKKTKVPVSVIVVNWKTRDLTINALSALFASTVLPEQIILVDNGSNDDTVVCVKEKFPQVEIIANKENLGFAKANNQAIREKVNQPFIWLLNSDTETGKKSLEQLYNYINQHGGVGAVGPQLVYPTRQFQSVGGFFPSISNVFFYLIPVTFLLPKSIKKRLSSIALYPQEIVGEGKKLDYVTGAASVIRRSALDKSGLLGEDYFMYFEETDLCWRLQKNGWEILSINTDPVMHIYGGSFKTAFDKRRLRLFLESLKIFVKKNYVGYKKWIILIEIFLFGQLSLVVKKLKNL